MIGEVQPADFDVENGVWIQVDFVAGDAVFSSRPLAEGEAEQITGWSTETLEQLRQTYSDTGS